MKKIIIGMGLSLLFLAGCAPNQAQLQQPNAQGTNQQVPAASAPATNPTTPSSETVPEATQPSTEVTSSASITTHATSDASTDTIQLSLTEAIKLFQQQYADTDLTEIKLKAHQGIYYYEMEGMSDDAEYDVWISATDGSLTHQKQDYLDSDEQGGIERRQKALNLENLISIDEVSQIALNEITDGTVINEWKLERELNTTYWEVHVKKTHRHAEVIVDAQSGQILEVDYD